ncbi:MAG: hypothetical protein A2289_17505 [Deltaproteobacteria bacterium RIFOXYA12_FULL_58_15]|nr:MAG: hypothetical protein A2289_17505 [Deltaproteobacteria bacterium RIFOXYA12_FULL_58_15]OGR13921.1 MAG: hypothetical protein A2341_26710 [Deltaproteobacteria bacterium RIFOXYB12_FULL_58_9]
MFRLPDNLLNLSAEEAARRIALANFAAAEEAFVRLGDEGDTEALHDFRVAIRRTRSTLRVYRRHLRGNPIKRLSQKLQDLQRATNDGRDAEVQIKWLEGHCASLTPSELRGHSWLLEHLRGVRQHALVETSVSLKKRFVRLARDVPAALGTLQVDLCAGNPPALAEVAGQLIVARVERLRRLLGRIGNHEDADAAHRARIAGKQLRYLLEPIAANVSAVAECAERLKGLQDVLGRLHDNHVLARALGDAHAQVAAQNARRSHEQALTEREPQRRAATESERPGLLVLTRQIAQEREELFGELELDWLGEAGTQLLTDIFGLSELLRNAAGSPVEIERKYLLASLPDVTQDATSVEIEQGWIPGERLMERIRRVVQNDQVTYLRTVKLGSGVQRIEIEEETSAEVFAAMWLLTAGKRVCKRRHYLEVDGFTWEIDAFCDRDLVLAEIELPTATTPVELPAWLAPLVIREVTDEAEFCNINLAR